MEKAIIREKKEPTKTRAREGISIKAPNVFPLKNMEEMIITITPMNPIIVPMFMPLFINYSLYS
jgi:hypothetical protein